VSLTVNEYELGQNYDKSGLSSVSVSSDQDSNFTSRFS
jgi:hypothetical protein